LLKKKQTLYNTSFYSIFIEIYVKGEAHPMQGRELMVLDEIYV